MQKSMKINVNGTEFTVKLEGNFDVKISICGTEITVKPKILKK